MLPLLQGTLWGVVGFLIGAGLTLVVRLVQGLDHFSFGIGIDAVTVNKT